MCYLDVIYLIIQQFLKLLRFSQVPSLQLNVRDFQYGLRAAIHINFIALYICMTTTHLYSILGILRSEIWEI